MVSVRERGWEHNRVQKKGRRPSIDIVWDCIWLWNKMEQKAFNPLIPPLFGHLKQLFETRMKLLFQMDGMDISKKKKIVTLDAVLFLPLTTWITPNEDV